MRYHVAQCLQSYLILFRVGRERPNRPGGPELGEAMSGRFKASPRKQRDGLEASEKAPAIFSTFSLATFWYTYSLSFSFGSHEGRTEHRFGKGYRNESFALLALHSVTEQVAAVLIG